jgi:hypothetical protein
VAILLTCNCGKRLSIDDRFAGERGQCPACGRELDIPAHWHADPPALPVGARAIPPPLPQAEVPATVEPVAQPVEERGPLTDHGGGPLPPDADFFVPPPRAIGELMSAYTTMRQGDVPWTPGGRAAWALMAAAFGILIGVLIPVLFRSRHPVPFLILPLALATGGAGLALWLTGFKRSCTYVGRDGVARFVCTGNRDRITLKEVFCFRDAMELRTSQTRHYVNGGYTGTNYSFTWTDVAGLTRHVISGTHKSEKGTPPLTDKYYYATGAEFAWTMHLLGQIEAKLSFGGGVTFNVNKHDWVRVSPGHLRFAFKGQTFDCPVEEIRNARVDQGTFTIERVDARKGWFSSEGIFQFPYSQLANAQLFLILLDKVAGVQLNN